MTIENRTPDTWQARIRAPRTGRKLTRSKMAELCNVAAGTIQDWEEFRIKNLTMRNATRVCEVLGIRMDWLLHGTGEAPNLEIEIQSAPAITDSNTGKSAIEDELGQVIKLSSRKRHALLLEPTRLLVAASDASFDVMVESLRAIFAQDCEGISRGDVTEFLQSYFSATQEKRAKAILALSVREQ